MNKTLEAKSVMLFYAMTNYMSADARRIQHFTKVHAFSRLIGLREGLDENTQFILEVAALMHDIGIREGERLYGRNDGRIQQELGPAEAEKILRELDFEEGTIARVCYLIGHHHTYDQIDGPDYQILVEADFLVNLQEDSCSPQACQSVYETIFRTKSGRQLMRDFYSVE